ncbi:MAG: hypothetical protein ACP5T2_06910 [Thermoprotei archaeon]
MDGALAGNWGLQQVELTKRGGEWYAHFITEKSLLDYEPQTPIGADLRKNLCVLTALVRGSRLRTPSSRGSEVKEVRHKYFKIRKTLQEKRRLYAVRRLGRNETKKLRMTFTSYLRKP